MLTTANMATVQNFVIYDMCNEMGIYTTDNYAY